jgi:hypothetical protein
MQSLWRSTTRRGHAAFAEILTPDALAFVAKLQRAFGGRREECLQRRQDRQAALDRGETLDFLPETKSIREGDWTCAPIPADLPGPPRRDHGADRSQDGDQRAEFGREDFHGGFRRRERAELEQHGRRADQSARRDPPHDHVSQIRRARNIS